MSPGWSSIHPSSRRLARTRCTRTSGSTQKAAFEAFITVRDEAEIAEAGDVLVRAPGHREPPADRSRAPQPELGALAPIRVVNVVFTAGDGNRGVQTAAYNLPNDERIIARKGIEARDVEEHAGGEVPHRPRAHREGRAQGRRSARIVSFDAFFTHILMHELMHGLGPHNITVGGRATTVRQELKQTYSTIEEAKADISGLWALQYLIDKKALPAQMQQTMYTTFLASAFRSIRFGLNEAHGRGIAIQLNYAARRGSIRGRAGWHVRSRRQQDSRCRRQPDA